MSATLTSEPPTAPLLETEVVTASAPLLSVEDVTLQYQTGRATVTAAYRVNFQVQKSDRLILLGPSGCGKSTLLKAVGGFVKPASGKIKLNGREITRPGADRGVVFQEFEQLLPWKTVRQNVIFALTASGKFSAREAEAQALEYLRKVKLEPFADAYPHTLSGGMKQRVAIARCLAMNPEIILMDEPFAALDALTRRQMQRELLQLWSESQFTMLFVTHSISEAIALGNRIVLLSPHPGQIKAELHVDLDGVEDERAPEFAKLHDWIHELLFAPTPGPHTTSSL